MNPEVTLCNSIQAIKADKSRYGKKWLLHPGFWVMLSYRIRRLRKHGGGLCKLLLPLDLLAGWTRALMCDTKLPADTQIGVGIYLAHPNGVIVNDTAIIGDYVDLFQQVTIGEWHGHSPVLEKGCILFAGAKVFGNVTIGEGAKIGANAVVHKDVPAGYAAVQEGTRIRPIAIPKTASTTEEVA